MYVKFYLKNNLKNKLVIFLSVIFTISLSFFCIPFYSHKTTQEQESPKPIKLPVVMYHLVLENAGNNNKFIVSAKTFEEDLKYIKENNYTTILVQDLIDYTENKKELPEKPILLTFDDGAYNNYLYAFPLAKKYDAKFVFSPIAREAERYTKTVDENPKYAHANWEKITEMSSSGLVEIQNHTYDMHSSKKPRIGCTKKNDESLDSYRSHLTKDLEKAQKLIHEHTGYKPTAFFYPFGACSACSEDIIKSLGFKATFMCESKINLITKNPECLYGLYRFLRPPNISAKQFFSQFEKQ